MDLEEGEIETEEEEALEDSVLGSFSAPAGFWSRPSSSSPRPSRRSTTEYRGKYRVDAYRRRPGRGRDKGFAVRNFRPMPRPFQGRSRQDLARERNFRDTHDFRREPVRPPYETSDRLSMRRFRSPEGQRFRVEDNDDSRRRFSTPEIESSTRGFAEQKGGGFYDDKISHDSDDYAHLVERHKMIQRALREYDLQNTSEYVSPTMNDIPYGADGARNSYLAENKSKDYTEMENYGGLKGYQANSPEEYSNQYFNEKKARGTAQNDSRYFGTNFQDAGSRGMYNHYEMKDLFTTSAGHDFRKEIRTSDIYALPVSQRLHYTAQVPEIVENVELTNKERQFICSMSQENYYGSKSPLLCRTIYDSDLHIHPETTLRSNTRVGSDEARLENHTIMDLKQSPYISNSLDLLPGTASDLHPVTETKKRKKRAKLKKTGKKKRKVKVLNQLVSFDSANLSSSVGPPIMETSFDERLSVDSLLNSCRQESGQLSYRPSYTAENIDDYESVAMDISGYSSEDKVVSPLIGKENHDYYDRKSEDEIDEKVLREQLLKSLAAKRKKREQECSAKILNAEVEIAKKEIEKRDDVKDIKRKPLHETSIAEVSGNRRSEEIEQSEPDSLQQCPSQAVQKNVFVPFKVKSHARKVIKYEKGEGSPKNSSAATEEESENSCGVGSEMPVELEERTSPKLIEVSSPLVQLQAACKVDAKNVTLLSDTATGSTKVATLDIKETIYVAKSRKKAEITTITLPQHDPLVIQVGGESDSEDEDTEMAISYVDAYLEEIKGELQGVRSPSSNVGSPHSGETSKDTNSNMASVLNDSLLFRLQKCIQVSKSKTKLCSDEYLTDRTRLHTLNAEVNSKKNKIDEQETKIVKIFKQLLAARKLKKIFKNSLEDSEEKVKQFKEQLQTKQFRLQALQREALKGEKVLGLAKKELLRQRLHKMKIGDNSSPTADSSPRRVNSEESSMSTTQDEQHLRKNRLISTHIQNITNRLTFLTNNLAKVQGSLEPKSVGKKRKSSDSSSLMPVRFGFETGKDGSYSEILNDHLDRIAPEPLPSLRGKVKVNPVKGAWASKQTVIRTVQPPQEGGAEKARLIELEKELRNRIAKYQHKSSASPSMATAVTKSKEASGTDKEVNVPTKKKEEDVEKIEVKDPLTTTAAKVEEDTDFKFLHNDDKIRQIQKIFDERLQMSSRFSSGGMITNPVRWNGHPVTTRAKFEFLSPNQRSVAKQWESSNDVNSFLLPSLHYTSTLLMFKAYRLCPFFRSKENLKLSSPTFSNKIDPQKVICPFDLLGKCLDDSCKRQHGSKVFNLSFRELLSDILSYDTKQTLLPENGKTAEDRDSYIESFISQYQGKISDDEIVVLLLNEIRIALKSPEIPKGYDIVFSRPVSRRTLEDSSSLNASKEHLDETKDDSELETTKRVYDVHLRRKVNRERALAGVGVNEETTESQEVRYFAESYNCVEELETVLTEKPNEVPLWISLSQFYLSQPSTNPSDDKRTEKALNALARGLDQNPQSENLWLHYLHLFAGTRKYEEVRSTCFKGVQCVNSFKVHWACLEILQFYEDKRQLCQNLLETISKAVQADGEANVEISGQITETLLYLISLTFQGGKARLAMDTFCQALGVAPAEHGTALPSLSGLLTCCDRSFLWLVLIHFWEFGDLPRVFDVRKGNLSRIVSRELPGLPFGKDQPLPSKRTQKYLEEAVRGVLMSHEACSNVCLSLIKSYLEHEKTYSSKEEFGNLLNRLDYQFRSFPDFCAINFTYRASLLSHQATVDIGRDLVTSSAYNPEMVYSYCKWLVKTRRKTSAINTITEFIRAKYYEPSARLDLGEADFVISLFKRYLGQSVETLGQLPPLQSPCNVESKDYMYAWMIYCLYLDLCKSSPGRCEEVVQALESAVTSYSTTEIRKELWGYYFDYQIRYLEEGDKAGFKLLMETLKRALVSIPNSEPLFYDRAQSISGFRFHNEIVSRCQQVISEETLPEFFEAVITLMPENIELGARVCQFEFERGNTEQARKIYGAILPIATCYPDIRKVAISVEASKKCYKEVRWLYQEAVKACPFNSSLWKEYTQFEIAHGKDTKSKEHALKGIFKTAAQYGVDVEDFVRKLMQ